MEARNEALQDVLSHLDEVCMHWRLLGIHWEQAGNTIRIEQARHHLDRCEDLRRRVFNLLNEIPQK